MYFECYIWKSYLVQQCNIRQKVASQGNLQCVWHLTFLERHQSQINRSLRNIWRPCFSGKCIYFSFQNVRQLEKGVSSGQGFSLNSEQGIFAVLCWILVVLPVNTQKENLGFYENKTSVGQYHSPELCYFWSLLHVMWHISNFLVCYLV